MVNSVEYITPAVQENTNTAHLVLARARHTIPRKGSFEMMKVWITKSSGIIQG